MYVANPVSEYGNDAGRNRVSDMVEQQVGEEEVAQVINAEVELEAVFGDSGPDGRGVVNQHVERKTAAEKRIRAVAHRVQAGSIELQELDPIVAGFF